MNKWTWKVELPNTDRLRAFSSLHECYDYLLENHGINHTEVDLDINGCYVGVPAFRESRKTYSEWKQKQVDFYGD